MTTPRLGQANHVASHDGNSPALQQRRYSNAARTRLTRINLGARENSLMRRIVCQSDTAHASFCVSFFRRIADFSRVGCLNQSTTLRISASNSIDIASSPVSMSEGSLIFFVFPPKNLGSEARSLGRSPNNGGS
jgi:hypothetical protein